MTRCITTRRLEFSPAPFAAEKPISARFPEPASLRSPAGGPSGLFLDVATLFTVVPAEHEDRLRRLAPRTEMYEYRLLDHDRTELLVYHWQPGAAYAGPDEPHLHVSASLNAKVDAVSRRPIGLDKLHVATGLVSLATVVRMLTVGRIAARELLSRGAQLGACRPLLGGDETCDNATLPCNTNLTFCGEDCFCFITTIGESFCAANGIECLAGQTCITDDDCSDRFGAGSRCVPTLGCDLPGCTEFGNACAQPCNA